MPHMHKKSLNGKTYWYLREMHRVEGKVKVKWQKYLGTAEGILKRLRAAETEGQPIRLRTESFGSFFVAHIFEERFHTIDIIDRIVRRQERETGPSIGEYFFYAWANRMIAPKSKRALPNWYRKIAVGHIRPVDIGELTSERYWEKWNRVEEKHLEEIGKCFLERVWDGRRDDLECVMFDTTNYFTYMASDTDSDLCQRGKSKASKHHLRQVGVGLVVDRDSKLPIYYSVYEGNRHDSKYFNGVIDEMFGRLMGFTDGKKKLTVVFDKGMNSDDNIRFIDDNTLIHFVTTYSTYFARDLAKTDLNLFSPVDTPKNRKLIEDKQYHDRLVAYRSRMNLWGQERTVVVTFNPRTYRKQHYMLSGKLDEVRQHLLEYRRRYQAKDPHWKKPSTVTNRYVQLCERFHISSTYYDLRFDDNTMSFRKNIAELSEKYALMGKNIIVTDNHGWTTDEIVNASLDRYKVEEGFRTSKSPYLIATNPIRHWTDSKIRCHLLTCVIAITCLRLLEIELDGKYSAKTIIEEMQNWNCVLSWKPGSSKPDIRLENPTALQSEILSALGYTMKDGWVLQVNQG